MADQLEIRGPNGERQLVAVRAGDFTLGSGPAADVRVAWPGVEPLHLRFVRTSSGVRVEPARPGATVSVGGEELFCKDLSTGDVIALAGASLRWAPGAPTPGSAVPRPVTTPPLAATQRARQAAEAPASRTRPRRRAGSSAPLVVLLVAIACGAAFVAYRHFRGSTWPASPQHYVDLARSQMANQRLQEALATLAFALREATGTTRDEAQRLEATIRGMLVDAAEMPKVAAARSEHDLLLEFVGRYLGARADRAAAREFVRSGDAWLERHRDVCSRVTEGQPLLAAIEAERARWVVLAALDTPDTAADVVFAAQSRLRFQWRDYRGAMARLDAFLAAQPGDATVTAARDRLLGEGAEWVQSKLRTIDYLLSRGDRDNAARDLDQLERWSVLPPWASLVAERRQRLAQSR